MKRIIGLIILVALVAGVAWLVQRGAGERAVWGVIDEIQTATLNVLNQRQPDALDDYFATEAEGAVAAGLAETRQAYKDFVSHLPGNNAVQFHSFDILALEVHEDAGLAKVTYRLHFSVIRSGQAIFSAKATQDIALRKTPRGWRISGGDAPQLEDVIGNWPRNRLSTR
jgi:ketosteroid isomerase-like protein